MTLFSLKTPHAKEQTNSNTKGLIQTLEQRKSQLSNVPFAPFPGTYCGLATLQNPLKLCWLSSGEILLQCLFCNKLDRWAHVNLHRQEKRVWNLKGQCDRIQPCFVVLANVLTTLTFTLMYKLNNLKWLWSNGSCQSCEYFCSSYKLKSEKVEYRVQPSLAALPHSHLVLSCPFFLCSRPMA